MPLLVPWLGFPPTVGLQGRWLHSGLGGGRVPSPSFYGPHGVFQPQHSPVLEQCLVHRGWPLVPEWLVGTHFRDLLLQMAVPESACDSRLLHLPHTSPWCALLGPHHFPLAHSMSSWLLSRSIEDTISFFPLVLSLRKNLFLGVEMHWIKSSKFWSWLSNHLCYFGFVAPPPYLHSLNEKGIKPASPTS